MDHNQNDDTLNNVTRRNFIKGVIATGAAVSSAAYVFRRQSAERAGAPRPGASSVC